MCMTFLPQDLHVCYALIDVMVTILWTNFIIL
jgi:hypothetical protein